MPALHVEEMRIHLLREELMQKTDLALLLHEGSTRLSSILRLIQDVSRVPLVLVRAFLSLQVTMQDSSLGSIVRLSHARLTSTAILLDQRLSIQTRWTRDTEHKELQHAPLCRILILQNLLCVLTLSWGNGITRTTTRTSKHHLGRVK
jgi:hypothetical protein